MNQPFSKFLETISNPQSISNILMKIKGTKVAAQIIKGQTTSKDPTSIIAALPVLNTSPVFYPYYNLYKNSSYFNNQATFANAIAKYL